MFNLMERKVIRDLDPDDIDRLVSVSGMVTRCSNIIPEVRSASSAFRLSDIPGPGLPAGCTEL